MSGAGKGGWQQVMIGRDGSRSGLWRCLAGGWKTGAGRGKGSDRKRRDWEYVRAEGLEEGVVAGRECGCLE